MIVSTNKEVSIQQFVELTQRLTAKLNEEAAVTPELFLRNTGRNLETIVFERLLTLVNGTSFQCAIELISGQKFPDIVVDRRFGIEVKGTTQDHWTTTGNSVNEATRVEGVEHVFILFGKLHRPVEFKCSPYEECLSEIVVTHSPRYLIDMNLEPGRTIMDRMKIQYNEFRHSDYPLKIVTSYYRSILPHGHDIWWLGAGDEEKPASIEIRHFSYLTAQEKDAIRAEAFVLFHELLSSKSPSKYRRFVTWLVGRHGVICSATRDQFTSGGQVTLTTAYGEFKRVPQVFQCLDQLKDTMLVLLGRASEDDLLYYWGIRPEVGRRRLDTWLKLAEKSAESNLRGTGLHLRYLFDE